MVMHARKYQRFNDGYHERNQAHPFEDKYPSKSHTSNHTDRYSDKSKDSPSFNRSREESPGNRPNPRYANKSSYIERTKDSLGKGSSSSPADRRVNHYPSSTPSMRLADIDHHSNHDKNQKEAKDQREREQKEKDHRAEIQKSALRVSGDWSEHQSSSGKHYYYNFRTEVSQWEKPKDWMDLSGLLVKTTDFRGKDKNGRESKHSVQSNVSGTKFTDDRYKHSISNERLSERSGKQSSMGSSVPHQSRYADRSLSHCGGLRSTSSTLASAIADTRHRQSSQSYAETNHHHHRTGLSQQHGWPGTETRDNYRRDLPMGRSGSEGHSHRHDRYGSSGSKSSAVLGNALATHNGARTSEPFRNENEDSRETEDMDISPGSTPTSSRPNSRTGTPYLGSSSTPVTVTTPTSASGSTPRGGGSVHTVATSLPQLISSHIIDRNTQSRGCQDITQQAIQTLQKLQQALLANQQQQLQQQQQQQHNTVSYSPRSAPDATPPPNASLPSPHRNSYSRSSEDQPGGESPTTSERSVRSSRHGSPTPSQASSQSVSLSRSLSAAGSRKPDSIQLTPSLSNYYSERLIQHVSGWQADHAERQAARYAEEAHTVGNLHCTQVSADLKKARSLVRIAEIQSTLQEQRILFLQQQIKELENMRSQNTYYQDT